MSIGPFANSDHDALWVIYRWSPEDKHEEANVHMQCGELCCFSNSSDNNRSLCFAKCLILIHLWHWSYTCNDIMKEWGSKSLQNSSKRHFCWNSKVHHIECTSSLLVFIFGRLARFYPQCIISWICERAYNQGLLPFLLYFLKRFI